jgi:hypothetical protein
MDANRSVPFRSVLLLVAGATAASLAFVASGWGGATATRGFTACKDARGYLYVPTGGTCPSGAEVSWTGEIPAVAAGAKSLTKDAVVETFSPHTFGDTIKDTGGWKRTKRYIAKCPLEYVAIAGTFDVDWPYVYEVNIVSSRSRTFQGVSAWQVLAVTAAPTNTAPKAIVTVKAICIARTAIFPSG